MSVAVRTVRDGPRGPLSGFQRGVPEAKEAPVNIGEPKRTIDVEPVTVPVPEELPVDEPAVEPELVPSESTPPRT